MRAGDNVPRAAVTMHTRQCAPRGCCRRSTAPDTAIVAQSVPDIAVLKAMVWQYGSAIVASVAQPLVLRHCIPVAYVSAGHRTLVPHVSTPQNQVQGLHLWYKVC